MPSNKSNKIPNPVAPLDLGEFETKLSVRELRIEDFDSIIELQQRCFPGMAPWGRDQIESQLRHFPEGQFCVVYDGQIVALTCPPITSPFFMRVIS